MNPKRISILLLLISIVFKVCAQLNQTDANGLKQGQWIKTYPTGAKMYEGLFRDGHPVGEFKRYFENGLLKSVLFYTDDGRQADAKLYYPDGRLASKGKYVDQKKEGKWQFFSPDVEGYLVSEQTFSNNLRNGISLSYYPDSTIGARTTYSNDVKDGASEQFYENGAPYIKSAYSKDKLNGPFEAWFANGNKMCSGTYRNDHRDGLWLIYNEDGSVRYRIRYNNGVPDNKQMEADASDYIDELEKQKGNIPDPEITGEMW